MVTHAELLELGFSAHAIKHRLRTGRLHRKVRGVYAVGSPNLTREGEWMVAVKACGREAALSHLTAAVLWGIWKKRTSRIDVSVPARANPRIGGVTVHRRSAFERTRRNGIPVTTIECTLIDLATILTRDELEGAINAADIAGHTDPEKLRRAAARVGKRPGAGTLARILDIATFRFTRSQLERAFIPIALRAGLPRPLTNQVVKGFEVDFYWPDRKLIVETDGLTYHRTAQQQAADLKRDQILTAARYKRFRFSHGQINFEPDHVEAILKARA